jgi:hypothetical protein
MIPLEDEVVGIAGETIDGALGADGIGKGRQPLVGPAV